MHLARLLSKKVESRGDEGDEGDEGDKGDKENNS